METYYGHVRTPVDAIVLFEACRLGMLPRVQRRLSEKERQSIRSGSVFVWDEREAGMRRWTDGKSWSASRVSGSFLTYREMEGKRGLPFAPAVAASRHGRTPDSTRGSDSDADMADEAPDGYRYKPDGLMKQSFSITTSTGAHLHLISYYSRSHPAAPTLTQPSSDANLRTIRPPKGLYPDSIHDQQSVPVVTQGPMPTSSYATSPHSGQTVGPPAYARPAAGAPSSRNYHYAASGFGWPPSPVSTPPGHQGSSSSGANTNNNNNNNTGAQIQTSQGAHPATLSPLQYSQGPSSNPMPPPGQDTTALPPPPLPHLRNSSSPHFVHTASPQTSATSLGVQQSQHQSPLQVSESIIDPRLQALPAPAPREHGSTGGLQTPPLGAGPSDRGTSRDASLPPTSSAPSNTIPGIGTLMNGAGGGASSEAREQSERGSTGGSPRASRSPGGTKKTSGPQDIPSEKLGFGEDVRALRVLDGRFLQS